MIVIVDEDEFKRLMPGRLIGVSVSIYNFY